MSLSFNRFLVSALACVALGAIAQTQPLQVSSAWARATVPGQGGSAAFMTLEAAQDGLSLVGASSPVAGVAQVHEMKLIDGTMRMRHLPALALPAHQAVALTPGGNHIMLMDLKQQLAAGSQIQITLEFKDQAGKTSTQTVDLPVRQNAPDGTAPAPAHGHHGS